jgi:hypothetical protein
MMRPRLPPINPLDSLIIRLDCRTGTEDPGGVLLAQMFSEVHL